MIEKNIIQLVKDIDNLWKERLVDWTKLFKVIDFGEAALVTK